MAEKKIVQVLDEVIEFPSNMSDADIDKAIRSEIYPALLARSKQGEMASRPEIPMGISHEPTEPTQEFSAAEMMRNVPESAMQFGKDLAYPFMHPIDTATGLADVMGGVGSKIAGMVDPEGQELLMQADPAWAQKQQQAEAMGQFLADRYGGIPQIKRTVQEDPVGAGADLAMFITGLGGTMRATGTIGKMGTVADIGTKVQKVGQALDPVNIATTGALIAPEKALGGLARSGDARFRMMESVVKPSTTLKPDVVRGKMQTLLDERIPITQKGVKMIEDRIRRATMTADDLIESAKDVGGTVDTYDLALKVMDDMGDQYKGFPKNRATMMKRLEEIIDDYPDGLDIPEAQDFKRRLYAENEDIYKGRQQVASKKERVVSKTETAFARQLMLALEDYVPELRGANKNIGQYLDVQKEVERAVRRMSNNNIISLTDYLAPTSAGALGGKALALPVSIVKGIFGNPRVKVKLAQYMHHVGIDPIRTQGKTQALLGVSRATEPHEEDINVEY
jgi:hypothetical protein